MRGPGSRQGKTQAIKRSRRIPAPPFRSSQKQFFGYPADRANAMQAGPGEPSINYSDDHIVPSMFIMLPPNIYSSSQKKHMA